MDTKTDGFTPPTGELWLIDWNRAVRYFAGPDAVKGRTGGAKPSGGRTAVVGLGGPLAKGDWIEPWGGTSTLVAQAAIEKAAADPDVDSIFLLVDSPGGEVAGTEELANAVYAARQVKPTHAHVDDLTASAALWVAGQADTMTANATAEVGSVGVVAMVADDSEFWKEAGVKFHVISTGARKGDFAMGVPIEKDALKALQGRVDELGEQFQVALVRGRGLSAEAIKTLSDGRVVSAEAGVDLGLVDGIMGRQDAFNALRGRVDGIAAHAKEAARRQALAEKPGSREAIIQRSKDLLARYQRTGRDGLGV